MWIQYWMPILIPTLINKSTCDNGPNDSIFIKNTHVDADYASQYHTFKYDATIVEETTATTTVTPSVGETTELVIEVTENVIFIPNEKPMNRREDEFYSDGGVRLNDVLMDGNKKHDVKEDPTGKVLFIAGKNTDYETQKPEVRRRNNIDLHYEREVYEEEHEEVPTEKPKLDCKNLDCNNTIKSICGGKYVHGEWKYRSFMNDCYYRKVNCGFKYEYNRYKRVGMHMCQKTGSYLIERQFSFVRKPLPPPRKTKKTRRSSTSRRSMTTNFNGDFCSHPCPTSCTEDYDPQCAVSATGRHRVFQNHCKLDYNSCFYSVVWHKRPLSDCIGSQKADIRNNRGFIDWMQRIGIVDKKGKLVLQ